MEKDVNTNTPSPPPRINRKAYEWVGLLDIEAVMGMAHDELPIYPSNSSPFLFFSYVRIARNSWQMMHGHEVVLERGRPIIWNDNTILRSNMRPDVAIIHAKKKTYFTCSQ